MTKVFIRNGIWRDKEVQKMDFELVSDGIMEGRNGKYVTVNGDPVQSNTKTIRIYIKSESDVKITDSDAIFDEDAEDDVEDYPPQIEETDDEIVARINDRFEVLGEMTEACANGIIKSLIVEGSAGAGKSFNVERTLENFSFHSKIAGEEESFDIIRGNISPIGLYKKLYEMRDEGKTVVFDDCDAVFFDQISLAILKAALDTTPRRVISWNTNSFDLKENDIPTKFEFQGAIIFITNMDLENTKSKQLKPHFEAIMSRSHYLNLTIKSRRDKFLRIKSLVKDGDFLDKYNFNQEVKNEVLQFIEDNVDRLRELSLRTTVKIADIAKMNPSGWKRICAMTVCK